MGKFQCNYFYWVNIDKIKGEGGKFMNIRIISLSITPKEVLELLVREVDGDLIKQEYYPFQEDRAVGYGVFEQFYRRTNHQKILMVSVENMDGITNVTLMTSSNPDRGEFDLEMEDDFMDEIMEILDGYIIDEQEI